jgi:hypothetical protein
MISGGRYWRCGISTDEGRNFFHVQTDAFNQQTLTTGSSEITPSNRTCCGRAKNEAIDPVSDIRL